MTAVPTGFPFKLSDDELRAALDEMGDPANWPGFDDFGRLLPELKLALLAGGLQEQERRESAASAARALHISYVVLAVAVVSLLASIVLALV